MNATQAVRHATDGCHKPGSSISMTRFDFAETSPSYNQQLPGQWAEEAVTWLVLQSQMPSQARMMNSSSSVSVVTVTSGSAVII
jgi:hypothetical protein